MVVMRPLSSPTLTKPVIAPTHGIERRSPPMSELCQSSLELLEVIEARGLLPMHDANTLSATSILAKEPVHGSWWSHPKANEMYRVISEIDEHHDVTVVKLLGGKLTFVHRRLWPALFAAVTARDE